MLPKILFFSYDKVLYEHICQRLNGQYELGYYEISDKENVKVDLDTAVYLCVLEARAYTNECKRMVKDIKMDIEIPVLFVAGKKNENQRMKEKVKAINQGVDEYLSYPQTVEEIIASMKSLIRWAYRVRKDSKLNREYDFSLYALQRKLYIYGEEIVLTKIEFDILNNLYSKQGEVVTYKELYEQVWHQEYLVDDNSIMAHIHRLRKKVERDPKNPVYVQNVYGVGYRFAAEPL